MKNEIFNIFMNVMHPIDRLNEDRVRYYFEVIFNTEFNKNQWEEWKKERNLNE
jgi:hypothetical protein